MSNDEHSTSTWNNIKTLWKSTCRRIATSGWIISLPYSGPTLSRPKIRLYRSRSSTQNSHKAFIKSIHLIMPTRLVLYLQDTLVLHSSPELKRGRLRRIKITKCLPNTADDKQHESIHSFAPQYGSADDKFQSCHAHLPGSYVQGKENWR